MSDNKLPVITKDPVAESAGDHAAAGLREGLRRAKRAARAGQRRIALSNGEHFDVYDTSGPQGCDPHHGLPKLRQPWIEARLRDGDSGNRSQMHYARRGIVTPEMRFVALRESVTPELRPRRARARPRDPAGEHPPPGERADDHRLATSW